MTHTDKFKTPVTTQNYRDNYNKIKWSQYTDKICKLCNDYLTQKEVDDGGVCEVCKINEEIKQ